MKVKTITYVGIFIALEILMTRFVQVPFELIPAFATSKDRISMGFLPVALSASMFGPGIGALTAAVADVIRALILPQGGAFNPAFSVSAALRGAVYGVFLHKSITRKRIFWASTIIAVFINILLNSFFVYFFYTKKFEIFVFIKLATNAINWAVQVIVLGAVLEPLKKRISEI